LVLETATRRGRRGATDDVVDAEADADAAAAATLEATSERAEAILAASGEAMARPSICGSFGFAERGRQRERERKENRKKSLLEEDFFRLCGEKKKKKETVDREKKRQTIRFLSRSLAPARPCPARSPTT
jgi:stalled ribosome alternative rescue factor ArfA